MKNILYLHGFASSSDSTKAKLFKEFVNSHKNLNVLTPDLPNNLIGWSKLIEELCEKHNPVAFIGSSMGGFYSTFFARKFGAMDVLLNPAVFPAEGMKSYLGKNNNYATGEEFIMKNDEIEHLKLMEKKINKNNYSNDRTMVLLESGDEVLNYKEAVSFYSGAHIKIISGGSHSLDSFGNYLDSFLIFIFFALKLRISIYNAQF